MGVAQRKASWTVEQYLEWENAREERSELVRGEVYAMVGARRTHGRVVANLARLLGNALRGTGCQVFVESMKLAVRDDSIVYPDLFVTCDAEDLRTEQVFRSPTLIIEVLSPSTQGYDRGLKFELYRSLPSLREYILIDPDTRRVDAFMLGAGSLWQVREHHGQPDADIALESLQLSVPTREVFEGIDPEE